MFSRLTLIGLVLLLAGCTIVKPSREARERLAELSYPEDAEYGPDLDMVVVRKGRLIELANRTPEIYEDVQLWINQQYVREIDEIDIGTDNLYHLNLFVNQYEESFPPGGFLRPDKGFPVVLAELYNPSTELRHRMNVQPSKE